MLQACRSQGATGTTGQEKSQSSNGSQLESGLGRAFSSLTGSPGARAGADGQSGDSEKSNGKAQQERGLDSQWSSWSEKLCLTAEKHQDNRSWGTAWFPWALPCVITLCFVLLMSPHLGNQHLSSLRHAVAIPNPSK